MISGHLTQKSGYWYIILNLRKEDGKKGPKWFSTGLEVKGNKRKAEEQLIEMRRQYTALEISEVDAFRLSFSEYLAIWLTGMKSKVSPSTYESYQNIVANTMIPYFNEYKLTLCSVKPIHIEMLYQSLLNRKLSPNTVLRYHAVIHKALKDAVRKELIVKNPVDLVQRPSKEAFITIPYSAEEMNQLFEVVKGHPLELIIRLTAFYGLRRSETLGLRWKAFDFKNGTLTINHTIQRVQDDGCMVNVARNKVKRKSSYRTLPLPDKIQKMILAYRNERYADGLPDPEAYLFVDKKGEVLKPDYMSNKFTQLLKDSTLRHVRFHDLRHSCAGILISNRVPLIEVQQWLGHSTINTTADLYAHLEYAVKERSASVMCNQLFNFDMEGNKNDEEHDNCSNS